MSDDTLKELRDIAEELFGPTRAALITDDDPDWLATVGAKNIDRIDFAGALQQRWLAVPGNAYFYEKTSFREIARFVDSGRASSDAH